MFMSDGGLNKSSSRVKWKFASNINSKRKKKRAFPSESVDGCLNTNISKLVDLCSGTRYEISKIVIEIGKVAKYFKQL